MQTLHQRFTIQYDFPVFFQRDVFNTENPLLASILDRAGQGPHRLLCFIDSGVMDAHPALTRRLDHYASVWSDRMDLCGPPRRVPGGEHCKNDQAVIDTMIRLVGDYNLCRHSFILAIGGGAVLDAVGYAAATAHRGVRLIRMPTTVLAQNDAGIGVKNGINGLGRKNFIGTFAPPFAVINDFDFLATLPARDLRAGLAEAVKVALILDGEFLRRLYASRFELAAFKRRPMEEMIHRCAALHMSHIGGDDPFETGSARPLDFGHWAAHKLEEITAHALNHGEAVAVGMALDSLYSHRCGLLGSEETDSILTLLTDLGLPTFHPALQQLDIPGALDEFRQHLGGALAITLLTGLGSRKEVTSIDTRLMQQCVEELARRHAAWSSESPENTAPIATGKDSYDNVA